MEKSALFEMAKLQEIHMSAQKIGKYLQTKILLHPISNVILLLDPIEYNGKLEVQYKAGSNAGIFIICEWSNLTEGKKRLEDIVENNLDIFVGRLLERIDSENKNPFGQVRPGTIVPYKSNTNSTWITSAGTTTPWTQGTVTGTTTTIKTDLEVSNALQKLISACKYDK